MEKKYIFILTAIAVAAGIGYYYYDDIKIYFDYSKEQSKIKEYAAKKIKKAPIDIKIENLNEL